MPTSEKEKTCRLCLHYDVCEIDNGMSKFLADHADKFHLDPGYKAFKDTLARCCIYYKEEIRTP